MDFAVWDVRNREPDAAAAGSSHSTTTRSDRYLTGARYYPPRFFLPYAEGGPLRRDLSLTRDDRIVRD